VRRLIALIKEKTLARAAEGSGMDEKTASEP
jgi:hypothetical protein